MLERPTRRELRRCRQRRYRERVRHGIAIYAVEIDAEGLEFLIKTHWLSEAEADDRDAVGRAIAEMLADAARN